MKTVNINPRLKPLYANLKRLHIGKYLKTNEFELLVLERNWDKTWEDCKNLISGRKTMFGVIAIDEDEREQAFAYFVDKAFNQWHQIKPFNPQFFGKVI